MPTITLNGQELEFAPGQTILQVALDHEIEIPHYCYHPELTIVANCRICLAQVWQPDPRQDGKLVEIPKLVPTCSTEAIEGQVVSIESPKAIASQKSVMEYLLINHPVDCPVCDQAGECHLQDYSYQYGRGKSRFLEDKNKQPKKDLGEHVLLYSDRCIMCTRCVRFCREVTGTGELTIDGRGSTEQIDVFPGVALDNPLSGNVIDICPVGALLDKDFLFQQRVWFLKKTPSIDGLTASGDNISVEHNDGRIYRVKPRRNDRINKWWISDETRYGWHFIHGEDRVLMPRVAGVEPFAEEEAMLAFESAYEATNRLIRDAATRGHAGLMLSPMLSCEDAYSLIHWIRILDPNAVLCMGPVPVDGTDTTFPGGYTLRAEKAPNARGIRRVIDSVGGATADSLDGCKAVVLTGNYPSTWVTPELAASLADVPHVLMDTLEGPLMESADVVIPTATWLEKSGSFVNADGILQPFARAIDPINWCKSEYQVAADLLASLDGRLAPAVDMDQLRRTMASASGLEEFADERFPELPAVQVESDMELMEL